MTDAEFTALLLSGLAVCYWAGWKVGVAVRMIKQMGKVS